MTQPVHVWRDAYGDTLEFTLTPLPGEDFVSFKGSGCDATVAVIHTTRPITFVEKRREPARPTFLQRLLRRPR